MRWFLVSTICRNKNAMMPASAPRTAHRIRMPANDMAHGVGVAVGVRQLTPLLPHGVGVPTVVAVLVGAGVRVGWGVPVARVVGVADTGIPVCVGVAGANVGGT